MTSVLDQVARKGQRGNFLEDLQAVRARVAVLERYLSTSVITSSGSMHDPVTLGASCAAELTISNQTLTLEEVVSDKEHTAALHEALSIDHGSLSGRNDDDHTIYLLSSGARQLTGNLSVAAGITIDGVDISAHAANADAHHAGFVGLLGDTGSATPNVADNIKVGGGNGILTSAAVNTVSIAVSLASPSGLGFSGGGGLQVADSLAGNGLSISSKVISLGTPSSVSVSSTNTVSTGTHAHAVTCSSDPGAAASVLATNVSGHLKVVRLQTDTLMDRSGGNLLIAPTADIQLQAGTNIIRVMNTSTLQSTNYASQTTGWGVTYAGAADFRYVFADEMHVKSFITDIEQALAGGQIICKSVTSLSRDFTAPAAGGAVTLYVRDLPSAEDMAVFQAGDIVRLRAFSRSGGSLTVADCWGVVTAYSNLVNKEQSWTFTRSTGSNAGAMTAGAVVTAESIVLDYGTSGNGYYEVNAIDGVYGANSPYSQIVTWAAHPATGKTVRTRLGNLYGITATTEYGLFAGEGVSAGDSYLRLTDQNFELHNLDLAMYDSGNVQRIGMDAGAATGDKLMWAGASAVSPGFVVYGDGDVWLSTLAISDRLGDSLFSLADGSLLLGPGCAITDTSWTSTRGAIATISGAFHQVDGRWPGTRALMVESGTTNYCVNSRPSSTGTAWAVYGGTFSFVATNGPFIGSTVGQIVTTAAANMKIGQAVSIAITTGESWTISFWAKAATGEEVSIYWQNTSSPYAPLSNSSGVTLTTSWAKYTVTLVATTTASGQLVMTGLSSGNTVQVANVQAEKTAFATSYCDGALGLGYSWSGAAHASTSTRTSTTLSFEPHGLIDLSNGSLSFWFRTPCAYNTAGLAATRGLFVWWDGWSSESFYIHFNSIMTAIGVTAYTGSVSQLGLSGSLPTDMKEGDWVHVVVTFTTNNVNLYINGAWKAQDTAYTAPTIANTTAYLGYVSARSCAALGEVAAFKRPLTVEEVSTIYMLNKPLTDCGSTTVPGIYILDGKLDLRSSVTGARVQMDVGGIAAYSSATVRTISIETDGDLFAGSNLASPLSTTMAVFSNDQTYGSESVEAGDVMIGSNITSANVYFDLSAGALYIRKGTTQYFAVNTVTPNLKFGSNLAAASTTTIAILGSDQTYNSEALGSGDMLIGDNSASKANILWDKSAGKVLFRGGTVTQVEIGTDGRLSAGGGNVKIGATGILLTQGTGQTNSITWDYSDSNIETRIRSYSGAYSTLLDLQAADYNASPGGVAVALSAVGGTAGSIYTSLLLTKEYATLYGFSSGTPTGDLRIRGGLYVGGIGTDPGDGNVELTGVVKIDGAQVVGNRVTGWAAATGAATRTTFATSTVTLEVLAQHVKALIDDVLTHGLIGS